MGNPNKGVKLKPIHSQKNITRNDGVKTTVTDQHFLIQADNDNFIMLYKKLSSAAINIAPTSMSVFLEICFSMSMGENSFVSNGQLFHDISKSVGISVGTVRNGFTELKREGLIRRDATFKRTYYVNPVYAWYGSQLNKAKIISFFLEQTSVTDENTKITTKGKRITISTTQEELDESFKK